MPATASAIRAGRAAVEIFADDARLARGLRSAQRRLRGFASGMNALGRRMVGLSAGLLAPLTAAAALFAKTGDSLDKMSARVGASVEFLSALGHAAAIGGTELSAMEVGIRRMQRSAYDATRGLSTATDAWGKLGINVKDANGNLKTTEALFMEAATALSNMTNNTEKAALATMIFGRAGTSLLPMLKNGKAGLVGVMDEAKRLGLVMSTADATAAAEFTDAITRLTASLKMVAVRVGQAVAPALKRVSEIILDAVQVARKWIEANQGIIAIALPVAAGIGAVGGALIGLSVAVKTVSLALGGIFTVGKLLATVFSLLTSPIGLVVAAIAAATVAFLKFTETGQAALSFLGEALAGLVDRTRDTMGAIGDAMAAGDVMLAAKVLWLAIKAEWIRGTNWLKEKWRDWKETFQAVGTEAVYGLAGILTKAWAGLQTTWVRFTSFLQSIWTKFTTGLADAWESAEGTIASGLAYIIAKAEDLDPAEVQKQLDAEYARRRETRHNQAGADLREIATERARRLAAIEQNRAGTLRGLDLARRQEYEDRRRARNQAERAADEALRKAQDELNAARGEAAQARADAEAAKAKQAPAADTGSAIAAAVAATGGSVRGTFSAAAVRGLGAGRSPEVKELQGIKKGVDRLVREAQESNLVFG